MLSPTFEVQSGPWIAAGSPKSNVLIVDDDEHFRDLVREMLEPAGFRVIEAEDVAQSLSQLRSHPVDAIVLDIVMPGRDGIEALPDFKMMSPRTKIVTVSGAGNSDIYLAVSAHLGADASLGKSKIGSLSALLSVLLDR